MKLPGGKNKTLYIVGAIVLAFVAYKFILPKLRGGNGGGAMPMPLPMPGPGSAPGLGVSGEGAGLGVYQQSAPGPAFLQQTMPMSSVRSAGVRLV